MSSGRISVLHSKELQTLLSAIRELPTEIRKTGRQYTKQAAAPIWGEEVRGRVTDRLQTRVLSDTAKVAVSDRNVTLRSGGTGTTRGVPNSVLTPGVEFGADPNSVRQLTSKKGTRFNRHTKRQFNRPRAGGYVVYPAARAAIPRLARLWVQTIIRTTHEAFERGGAK